MNEPDATVARQRSIAGVLSGLPRRHVIVALTFVTCIIAYTDRVNISVAAVAMGESLGWSPTQKGMVLSSFFVGYILFMFAGGLLSTRFGGRLVLGASVFAWSLFTLLTPPAAAWSLPALIAARIGMGIGEAAMFPGAYELIGRWVPAGERSRASGRLLSGIPIGTIAGLFGGGWLVEHFGWPAAFYAFGVVGLVLVVVWFRSVSNDPFADPRVTAEERAMLPAISNSGGWGIGEFGRQLVRAPALAIVAAHFAQTWCLYVLLSWLPSYFRNVHGLSISNAGLYSALPWLAMFASANVAVVAADRLIARGTAVTRMRKLMQCGSLIGTAATMLVLPHAQTPLVAVSLLCFGTAVLGVSWAGFGPAMLDVAPRSSAVLYGFSNTIATIPGIVGVGITGWLLDVTGTYTAAFALTAAVSILGAIAFGTWFDARPVGE